MPIDVEGRERIVAGSDDIKLDLISAVDGAYGVFEGEAFRADRFEHYLEKNNMAWPRLTSQRLDLKQDTFREMARVYPQIQPLHELRHALSELRLNALEVGTDGRNRVLLSPFRASSSRNAPSTTKFIFCPACWLRSLIRPRKGFAIAYIDYEQHDLGIAAALSADPNMIRAYASGDPYLTFGKQARRIPEAGTKATPEPFASFSRHAASASSTEWVMCPLRAGSVHHSSLRAICSSCITGRIRSSGAGPMRRSSTRCSSVTSARCSVGPSTSA